METIKGLRIDDDKFVDCTIAGGADFLVTDDKHFNILKNTPFPKVSVLPSDEFLEVVLGVSQS